MASGTYIRTEEYRTRMSLKKMGVTPWNKGIPCSEQTKAKLSLANRGQIPWNKGRPCSEEQKTELSLALTGKVAWNKGIPMSEESKEKLSQAMRGNKNAFGCNRSDEVRAKVSMGKKGQVPWIKGRHHTEESKAKLSKSRQGIEPWIKGKTHTEETKIKIGVSKKGQGHSEKTRKQMRKAHNKLWGNPEYRDSQIQAIMRGANVKPNKPELLVLGLLDTMYPNEWEYVGDGKLVMDGLCPDIANVNGRKLVIEIFGQYWHSDKKVRAEHQTEQGRIEAFRKFGFETLVIWERELEDLVAVSQRIREFVG